MSETSSKKRKLSLPLVLAGGISSLVLALGMSPTFSAFSASIQNTVDTAGSGALIMQETDSSGSTICNSADSTTLASNSATCATINKYGGNISMVPGQIVNTTINIKDTGTVNASSFSLTPGLCTQTANGNTSVTAPTDLCTKIKIVIMSGTHEIFNGTAASLYTLGVIDVNLKLGVPSIVAGAVATPFVFTVTLDSSVGNAYQGLKVSQPLTWTFGA
jgi:hypothetical protein